MRRRPQVAGCGADGFDPSVATPSIDETKFEYTTCFRNPSRP
jgi:hypothetical protein